MEWVDSVVNSMERRVNSFSILTAVMNGRFVYCAHLRGPAHVIPLGDSNHFIPQMLGTHKH